jgi:hypothetical protein
MTTALAMKFPARARQFSEAISPRMSHRQLKAALETLREICATDPACVLAHTAKEHRETAAALDGLLNELCYAGRYLLHSAAPHPKIARELEARLPAANENLRTTRALIALLLKDTAAVAGETAAVARAQKILEEQAATVAEQMSEDERAEYFSDVRPDPAELEAWLADP